MPTQPRKTDEHEDYGATGKTRRKPAGLPKQGPAPVHRGEGEAPSEKTAS